MNTIDQLRECLLEAKLESTCDITTEHIREAIQTLAGQPLPGVTGEEEWIDLHQVFSLFLKRLPASDPLRQLIEKAIREEIT